MSIKLEDTVVIMYAGGSYGKYLYWVLNNFTTLGTNVNFNLPFDSNGASHLQKVNNPRFEYWNTYLENKSYTPFYVLHWFDDNGLNFIDSINKQVNKTILIKPKLSSKLMLLNNAIIKTYENFTEYPNLINEKYHYKFNKNNIFEVREFLSYKAFNKDFLNHMIPQCKKNKNMLVISLNELLYNFSEVILKIINFLNTSLTVPVHKLLDNHNKMLSLQKHLTKDADIKYFLECFEQEKDCSLPKYSTIIDEAYIQHYLRDKLNLEIKCYNLIDFPKTTTELRKITYSA